jgi:hypothetical protein
MGSMALCSMWCTEADLCCEKNKYTQEQIDDAILGASEILDRDSYHQYGICTYSSMPCTEGCSAPCWDRQCRGHGVTLDIPKGPIVEVVAINVFDENGDEVANTFQNDVWWEYNTVYFPADFVFPDQASGLLGGPSTWNIEVLAGHAVPVAGKKAAVELAREFLKDPCDDDCVLPAEIRAIARDGMSATLVDIKDAIAMLPWVSKFEKSFCQTRRWSGAVSPLNMGSQLVQ